MDIGKVEGFLQYLKAHKKLFYPSIYKCFSQNRHVFVELGTMMLTWAHNFLGEDYEKVLADGYSYFVTDVNKSQMLYERTGRYKHSSYQEVYKRTYNDENHMKKYHWGVYVTTFVWEHHLSIYKFFIDHFVNNLSSAGNLLELGSGSGIWGMILMNSVSHWQITGIDISKTSVNIARQVTIKNGFKERSTYIADNALTYTDSMQYDAGISCFLMEHLEEPQLLLNNLCKNVKTGGLAFITCALTASEIDHIYEFRRESEVLLMAEQAGFRTIACFSAAPALYSTEYKFLPRSMALVLQKRHNDIW